LRQKGYIYFYNPIKEYGFIKADDEQINSRFFFKKDFFLDDNVTVLEESPVEFLLKENTKGLVAEDITLLNTKNKISQDYRDYHLKKRLTSGLKYGLNLKGNSSEVRISKIFSSHFGITFSREERFKNKHYTFNFLQPSAAYKESFNMFDEFLMIFSDFDTYDERVLDYVDKLLTEYSNRLDPVVIMLISKDINIKNIVKERSLSNKDSRIIIPFTYNEIINENFSKDVIQERLREFFYQRDLFAMESPLKSDNYFYGRKDIVHTLYDKYNIGEQSGLFGLRKTGKTSVLFAVERLVHKKKGNSIYIDCQSPSIYKLKWFELLEKIIDGLIEKYPNTISKEEVFTEKNASDIFKNKIKELYMNRNHRRVLLIFDEIEHISFETSLNDGWKSGEEYLPFWQTIRSIIQTEQEILSFIISGVNPNSIEKSVVMNADNPIFNNTSITYLSLFSVQDVKKMVTDIGNYMGLEFDEAVIFKLHENYGGHPFLIRNVCSKLNEMFTNRPYIITKLDYEAKKQELDQFLISYIRSILSVLETFYSKEFYILKDIALKNFSKINSYKHEMNINHLKGYGIIEESNQQYFILIDSIREYLVNNYHREYIPNSDDEYRNIISDRRNEIEKSLRKIVKISLIIKYNNEKIMNNKIKNYLKLDSWDSIQARDPSVEDKFDLLFFKELSTIINNEYDALKGLLNIDKPLLNHYFKTINNFRIDAHAKSITEEDYRQLDFALVELEKKIDKFSSY